MICARYAQSLEEIGIDLMLRMGFGKTRFPVDSLHAHLPHEGPDVDPSCFMAPRSKLVFHAP